MLICFSSNALVIPKEFLIILGYLAAEKAKILNLYKPKKHLFSKLVLNPNCWTI